MFLDQLIKDIPGVPAVRFYIKRDHNPQSGNTKHRIIWTANEAMTVVHERLKTYILHELKNHISPHATACWRGSNHIRNAACHIGSRYFYLLDLDSAYPSLTPEMASEVICSLDPRLKRKKREVINFLARYCFLSDKLIDVSDKEEGSQIRQALEQDGNIAKLMKREQGGLITGGPAAPWLFDLVIGQLIDKPIQALLQKIVGTKGWIYTRYLDDLTFSFPEHRIDKGYELRKQIRQIITNAGFGISDHKARLLDIRKSAVSITGINLVYQPDGTTYAKLSRAYLEKLQHNLYLANKPESTVSPQKVAGWWGAFKATLEGRTVPLTRLELQVVWLHRQYQQSHGQKPPDPRTQANLRRQLGRRLRGKTPPTAT